MSADDAQKKKSIIDMVDKMVHIVNEEIKITNETINSLNKKIESQKENLKNLTSQIVELEEKIKKEVSEVDRLTAQVAGLQSQIDSLNSEIKENNDEIERLKQEIQRQMPKMDVWDILNHVFNPIGSAISDIVRGLTNNIQECQNKIGNLTVDIANKQLMVVSFDQVRKASLSVEQQDEENILNTLKLRDARQADIRQTGIEKTNTENHKLKLEGFINKCEVFKSNADNAEILIDADIDISNDLKKEFEELHTSPIDHLPLLFGVPRLGSPTCLHP